MTLTNPERDQERVEEPAELFRQYGYAMFRQQRAIYGQIAKRVSGCTVLEAGCGNGLGSAMLDRNAVRLVATDKLEKNVLFAGELYPWLDLRVWDMTTPCPWGTFHTVVCVEAIEHVADPLAAMRNLVNAANQQVFISTPNGAGKPRPPSNPWHVAEYAPTEMIQIIRTVKFDCAIHVLGWEDFQPVSPNTTYVSPLMYRIQLP